MRISDWSSDVCSSDLRAVDPLEPEHVAVAAAKMGLTHIVITSVDRDELPDGGARQFVRVIEALRRETPQTTIEILTADFRNKHEGAVASIGAARPDRYEHNLEAEPRRLTTRSPGSLCDVLVRRSEQGKPRPPSTRHDKR